MPWDRTLDSLKGDIRDDVEDYHRDVATDFHADIISNTVVGNPSRWKNPNSAPRGYVGGTLKSSWQIEKRGDNWVVFSNEPYAEAIWDGGHSRRHFEGITGAIDVLIANFTRG